MQMRNDDIKYRYHMLPAMNQAGEVLTAKKILDGPPAYSGGAYYNKGLVWKENHKCAAFILAAAGADLENTAHVLGRPPTNIVHYAAEHFRLSLARHWWDAIRKERARKPRVASEASLSLAYPFVVKQRDEHADLLTINALVPQNMPGREDVCQEIMLALLEGEITIDQVKANRQALRPFIRQFRKDNLTLGGYALSLDAPLENGRSWHEVFVLPGADYAG